MRFKLFSIFAILFASAAFAQNPSTHGNIVSGAATCQSSNCVYYQLPPNTPYVVVTISGTWSGTIAFQSISAPNANYSNLNSVPWTNVATEIANGNWSVATGGATFLLIQAPTWSSGSAQVSMFASQTGSPMNNPVFPGTITATGLQAPDAGSPTEFWQTNGGHAPSTGCGISGTCPISAGGTGATTLAGARANLGVPTINVINYGAVADGSTLNSTFIQNAVNDYCSTGAYIWFPGGPGSTYLITSGIQVVGCNNLTFGGAQGVTIQVAASYPDTQYNNWPNYGLDSILRIVRSSNITVEGLQLDGNLPNRTPHAGGAVVESFNSDILVAGSTNVLIQNNNLLNGMTDGVTVTKITSGPDYNNNNVKVLNNLVSTGRRNNISVTAVINGAINGNTLIGAGTVSGTPPEEGLDIEADNATNDVNGLTVDYNTASGNVSNGIALQGSVPSNAINFDGNITSNNEGGGLTFFTTTVNTNVNVTGGQSTGNVADGLRVQGDAVSSISGVLLADNNSAGMAIFEANHLLVTGCELTRNTYAGFLLGLAEYSLPFGSVTLTGNQIHDNPGVWGIQAWTNDASSMLNVLSNTLSNSPGASSLQYGASYTGPGTAVAIGNTTSNLNPTSPPFSGATSGALNPWLGDPVKPFSWQSNMPFANGTADLVGYVDFGDVPMVGTLTVSLSSGYNYISALGIITEQISIVRYQSSAIAAQTATITASSGLTPTQFALGPMQVDGSNHLKFPVYLLTSLGNVAIVTIQGAINGPAAGGAPLVPYSPVIVAPTVVANSQGQQVASIAALLPGSVGEVKPTCAGPYEGYPWYTLGSGSTNGDFQICQNQSGTYEWVAAPALAACSDESSTFTPVNSTCYFVTAAVSTATPAASAFTVFAVTTSSGGSLALTGTAIADGGNCSSYISGTTLTLPASQSISVKSDGTTIRATCTVETSGGTATLGGCGTGSPSLSGSSSAFTVSGIATGTATCTVSFSPSLTQGVCIPASNVGYTLISSASSSSYTFGLYATQTVLYAICQ